MTTNNICKIIRTKSATDETPKQEHETIHIENTAVNPRFPLNYVEA